MTGKFVWKKGDTYSVLPYDIMCNNKASTVNIVVESK